MARERLDLLTECLLSPCARDPLATALVRGDSRIRYRALRDRCAALAAAMDAEGAKKGDVVALMLTDGVDFVAHMFAVLACGATVVPIAADAGVADVARLLEASTPSLVIATATLPAEVVAEVSRRARTVRVGRRGLSSIEALERAGSRGGRAIGKAATSTVDAIKFYADGSDGELGSITFTHRQLVRSCRNVADALPGEESGRVAALGPLHQPAALVGQVLATLGHGGTLYFADPDDGGDHARWVRSSHVDTLGAPSAAVLAIARQALEQSAPIDKVEVILKWGARLTPDEGELVRDAFPAAKILRWHGMDAETGRATVCEELAPGLIERGGEGVSPTAVEATLQVIPGIEQAAVVGVVDPAEPDPRLVAFVVAPGGKSEKDWRAFVQQQLSPARQPDRWIVVDEIARNDSGQPDRAALAAQASGGRRTRRRTSS